MIGHLIEYKNPGSNQRWGIVKQEVSETHVDVATGWYPYLKAAGTTRKSNKNVFNVLTPEQIREKASAIENYFFGSWACNTAAPTATLHFVCEEKETKIDNLPPWVANSIVDSMLADGYFAYSK